MSVNDELEEHVHHAKDSFEKIIAANMAIVAALLAIVSVLGQHYNTEELLKQQQSSDQWAYYQAKDIRRYVAQSTQDVLAQGQSAQKGLPQGAATSRYSADAVRYTTEENKIKDEAGKLEKERDESGKKATQFHIGEVFLEVAIVLLSLSILSKRRVLAYAGFASAVFGVVWSTRGFFY